MGSRCGQASGCKGSEVDVRESDDEGHGMSGGHALQAGEPPSPSFRGERQSAEQAAGAEEVVASRNARMPSDTEEVQDEDDGEVVATEEEDDDDEEDDDGPPATEQVWSAVVEIDRGFPFDFVWPGMKVSIFRALRVVSNTWPAMGWQNEADLELTLRRAVESEGAGPIARGLNRSQADRVVEHLRGELPCSVRLDREGAASAAAIIAAAPSQDDGPRRERLRRRLRELRERAIHEEMPLAGMGLLHHIERDLEDDERWRSRAVAMAHALDRLQNLGPELMDPFNRALSLASMNRKITISVKRDQLLTSAMGPVLSAAPHDLCPGRLCMKYVGEEGEDGDGGGGVTRAFLTHAGELVGRPQLGLLLPCPDGHLQLSPLPGFLATQMASCSSSSSSSSCSSSSPEAQAVWQQPEHWCRFLGRLLGMAVVHESPLGLLLAPSLCKQLLDQEPCFEDLQFVPGLSSGGSGWYSTLRLLLAHRAPDLVKEDPTLAKLENEELDKALQGLEAVMPSRPQQIFEALAEYAGGAAHTPPQWVGAAEIAAGLLGQAKTGAQRKLAMAKAKELIDGVLVPGRELPPDMPRALQGLRLAIQTAGAFQLAKDPASQGTQQAASASATETCGCGDAPGAMAAAAPGVPPPGGAPSVGVVAPGPLGLGTWVKEEEPRRWAEGPLAQIQSWRLFVARGPRRVLGAWRDAAHRRGPGSASGTQVHGSEGGGQTQKSPGPPGPGPGRGSSAPAPALVPTAATSAPSTPLAPSSPRLGFSGLGLASLRPSPSLSHGQTAQSPGQGHGHSHGHSHSHGQNPGGRAQSPEEPQVAAPISPLAPTAQTPTAEASAEGPCQSAGRPQPTLERAISHVQAPGLRGGEPLSAANLQLFAKAVAGKALSENLKPHLDAVIEEFRRIVSVRVRGGLSWQQLQARVSGQRLDPVSFVRAWRERTTYQACTEDHAIVRLWWSYVSERTGEDLLRLFAWCTGFAAIPATAWKFRINVVDDVQRCPTVNTCMTDDTSAANRGVKMPTVYLPAYSSKATLAQKMDWAIAGASGIHLH